MRPQNEHELISACLKGNQQAQRYLYNLYKADLFGLCLRYAHDREEAHDILQEGFIKIFKNLDRFKPICPVIFWMKKIMVNAALEHLRKHKKHKQSQYELNEEICESQLDTRDVQNTAELVELIQKLPVDYRMVFNLYAIEGYTHKEIAELMDIKESTSKVRLMRARGMLQMKLKQQMSA